MSKLYPYLLSILLLSSSSKVIAQDDGYLYDSVIAVPPGDDAGIYDEDYYQDNSYFNPKNNPSKVEERTIEEEKILSIKAEDEYWYADLEPKKKQPQKKSSNFLQTDFVKTLFWILVTGGFVALLIWFLASGNISLFGRKTRIHEVKTESEEEEGIFSVNYDRDIQKAINANDHRLAVRLMYLQVLKEMAERNIIKYSPEKTNSDYLFQLFNSRYYKPFFTLTRHFDYIWYGHFILSAEAFRQVQNDFSSFKQQLS